MAYLVMTVPLRIYSLTHWLFHDERNIRRHFHVFGNEILLFDFQSIDSLPTPTL